MKASKAGVSDAPEAGLSRWADFDEVDPGVLRSGSGLKKWRQVAAGVLPAGLAEMDFPVAEPIREGLRRFLAEGMLGYPYWPDGSPLREAFAERMAKRYGWRPRPEAVREFATVTQGVHLALHLGTEPGDAVAVHTPVYGPFRDGLARMGRRLIPIPLRESPQGWGWDPDLLVRAVVESGCRALVLVNPHNPTGRVFRRSELTELAELAERHDLLVISDEIHADLTHAPHRHIPFASLGPEIERRTVTLTSATKAFNLAGARCAVGHLGPARLRAAVDEQPVELYGALNALGVHASLLAWTEGDAWLTAVRKHLAVVRDRLAATLADRLPQIGHHPPEGSYLAWLDCRALGLGEDPAARFRARGDIDLSPGPGFGPGGDGFVRLNFATSGPVLDQLLERLVRCAADGAGAVPPLPAGPRLPAAPHLPTLAHLPAAPHLPGGPRGSVVPGAVSEEFAC
ncbi:cystathione beta-lyase [Streptomyces sp. 2224.1]|uniref:MalY/PatB family protein n=1 Tax=unclassified Streptomyces TaxID=2593676 RepID=UPI000894E9B3|nr:MULTISPECIES: aminotransferase class I/II-fold pyridoxal phosphate-dependent enzyme [unclassified Streptomyces]SED33471.1 cystathione beta-lyase [Streptomyces sp. 2224.1]SEF12069.1 cystathione beta-lyase [Streptomyces sp. 2112.3]